MILFVKENKGILFLNGASQIIKTIVEVIRKKSFIYKMITKKSYVT